MLASRRETQFKVHRMKKWIVIALILQTKLCTSQVKLYLDSQLIKAYEVKYRFSEGLMCVPFYCDPFYETMYKKADTTGICGKYVFVDRNYNLKIGPVFSLPCWFEPRFSEGLCGVNIQNRISFIDTQGRVVFQTSLLACSPQKNKILPFRNGRAKVYRGGNSLKHYYEIYYIDRNGKRIPDRIAVKVKPPKPKGQPDIAVVPVIKPDRPDVPVMPPPISPVNVVPPKGKYPIEEQAAAMYLSSKPHAENRMLLYFDCGQYQYENMHPEDTVHCGKFVFSDSLFNIKIAGNFSLPCAFEPEFSEGLCAVSVDSVLVYIDSSGRVVINTGLKSCSEELNKASTFRNGIATLYAGSKDVKGLYTTIAINTAGERVRLLEFDDLELAEKKLAMFSNLSPEEAVNCFVGRGKTNGLWFLVEKSGKVRKKLELVKQ